VPPSRAPRRGTGLVIFALSFKIDRGVSTGVVTISRSLQAIARGDLSTSEKTSRRDEFGQMAAQLHDLRSQVQTFVKELSAA